MSLEKYAPPLNACSSSVGESSSRVAMFSSLADYDRVFCGSCLNVQGGVRPCSDFEKCALARQTLFLQQINANLQQLGLSKQPRVSPLQTVLSLSKPPVLQGVSGGSSLDVEGLRWCDSTTRKGYACQRAYFEDHLVEGKLSSVYGVVADKIKAVSNGRGVEIEGQWYWLEDTKTPCIGRKLSNQWSK